MQRRKRNEPRRLRHNYFEEMTPEAYDALNKTYARVNRLFLDLREVEAITWKPSNGHPKEDNGKCRLEFT